MKERAKWITINGIRVYCVIFEDNIIILSDSGKEMCVICWSFFCNSKTMRTKVNFRKTSLMVVGDGHERKRAKFDIQEI